MGAKDSKRACLSYEEAVKHMTEVEYKRVCTAFKQLSGGAPALSRAGFTQHVLGEGVPTTIAELLYTACGGTARGISLRDLICGLVLITKGDAEQKIRFLWALYSNEAGTHIYRNEFQTILRVEGTLPNVNGDRPNLWWDRTIISLFGVGQDRVGFDHFRAWIQYNKEATVLSRLLLIDSCITLSSELETPTFYQTLAGVTHLEEHDICELEKCFWSLSSSSSCGQLDLTCVRSLVSPPVPLNACRGLFNALDVNGDGHVDFKELCCGISAACRGPTAERIKFSFKIFDSDGDGALSPDELQNMIDILFFIHRENTFHSEVSTRPTFSTLERNNAARIGRSSVVSKEKKMIAIEETVDTINNLHITYSSDADEAHKKLLRNLHRRINGDGYLSQEEFVIWGVDDNVLIMPLLELLFEVCHVSLGLRPHCRHHEYEIVMGWLSREEARGYRVGQFWYLISTEWWQAWINYTTALRVNFDHCTCRPEPRLTLEEGIVCDESFTSSSTDYNSSHSNEFTSNSTESMGDLLSRGDSCSIASSSGVSSSSSSGRNRNHGAPGPIDNSSLVAESLSKVTTLTGEGGRLKRDTPLVQHRDFELVPDSLWKALSLWYGGPLPLPRQVIRPPGSSDVELELYPLNLRILRHQLQQTNTAAASNWTSVVGGYGAAALSTAGISTGPVSSPRRALAHMAAFSRLANIRQVIEFLSSRLGLRVEDVRLWHVKDTTVLLDDENATLQDLAICDNDQILLEVRNKDLTWPEELGALASGAGSHGLGGADRRPTISLPPGATGLHNLGNTCFMNAALQAVSNTRPLTQYFQRDLQLCELNSSNPLGTRGQVARRYAELCRELWAGSARSVAPLKLRFCVTKHAPHLGGGGQHDSQELLAWLLDALHEDLNRVPRKQYTELRDSDGRPDTVVAEEAWLQHLARDHSIITDLFYGQLKSKVTCQTCGHESVRFDAFNLLSLPLPMESFMLCEVLVIRLNGATPVKYGLRLNSEAKYLELKQQLETLCEIPPDRILLAEVAYSQIRQILSDDSFISQMTATEVYAFELPEIDGDGERTIEEDDLALEMEVSQSPLARSPETAKDVPEKRSNGHFKKMSIQTSQAGSYTDASMKLPSYLIAVHRKCVRQETYFLSQHKSKPSLFGIPLLLGCTASTTCQELYETVWGQVTRLLSPLPQSDQTNHATDCDDSLGYEFPFTLKAVLQGGQICALCHWSKFCRGCSLPCSDQLLFDFCKAGRNTMCIAIDWDPTALHLRYQSNREKVWIEHDSVMTCRKLHTEPIDLDYCLKAFTSEERLEAKYHCSKCQDKQPATKKLQIWRLPPILIIHLKRFDYVNKRWVKTQKVVNFPFKNFDPTAYLASVPQETILRHRQLIAEKLHRGFSSPALVPIDAMSQMNGDIRRDSSDISDHASETSRLVEKMPRTPDNKNKVRERLISTSLQKTPIVDEHLRDFHEHKLTDGQDKFDLKYQLYAVVSHSGLLNGGHYISYGCNPNGHWYCYNDSSCREVPAENPPPTAVADTTSASIETNNNNECKYANSKYGGKRSATNTPVARRKLPVDDVAAEGSGEVKGAEQEAGPMIVNDEKLTPAFRCAYSDAKIPKIDTSNAYILFYERSGLNYKPYLPEVVANGQVVIEDELEDNESELRKQQCRLQ